MKSKPTQAADYSENNAVIETTIPKIQNLEDLLKFMKVDLNVWEVERHTISKSEMVMREAATTVGGRGNKAVIIQGEEGQPMGTLWTRKNHKPQHENLFHVKAWLKRKVPKQIDEVNSILDDIVERVSKNAPVRKRSSKPKKDKRQCMVEFDIFDHHIGKLCWRKEVGKDWDINIAQSEFRKAIDYLMESVKHHPISKIVFPIGNDYFHVDNNQNLTTKGTPQDVDGRAAKSFDVGCGLITEAVDYFRTIAPVDVVPVNGNHDFEKIFYLARIIEAHYRSTSDVFIDPSLSVRKVTEWGDCAIGFTHGNEEKHSELPMIFSESFPEWRDKKFKEIHIGHWHQRKTISFQPRQSLRRTNLRFLSSLTPADAWHHLKGYSALRAATAFVWEKKQGCIAEYNYHPDV